MTGTEKANEQPHTAMQDREGNVSAMRLMAAFAVAAAILICLADVYIQWDCSGKTNPDTDMLVLALLGGGFGGKTVQRFAERKGFD